MPSLTLFNRAWRFGSDDFVFPGIAAVFLRGSWLVIVSTIFGLSYHDIYECNKAKFVRIFFFIILPLLLVEFVTEICITTISMKGSIMNTRARLSITKYIYFRLLLFIPELTLTIMGSIWIFKPGVNCGDDIIWTIRVLIGCQWVFLITVLVLVVIFFNPMGKLDAEGKRFSSKSAFQQALENQFQNTCFCPRGNQQAFQDIAREMAKLFHDVDLVASDIAAALLLLYRKQRRKAMEEAQTSRQWLNERLVTQQDTETWEKFDESAYFYHYAMGCYGWPLYMYMHFCCGFCQLCKVCKCSCAGLFNGILIEGDTCCHANTSGFISQLPQHDNVENVFVSFTNEVYQTPFCVSIDSNYNKVVISVRGTLSLKDVITDLTAETENLEFECDNESEEKCEAHKGMTKSARFIMEKLEKENILEPIFLRHPDYGLVIVGHSLGAGTATILAILMKKKYETLKCYAISPPQVLNLKAAELCEDFVTSVIVGNDIVARLSNHSLNLLKKDIIEAINQCQLPKYQILLGGCWQMLCSCLCSCFPSSEIRERTLSSTSYFCWNCYINISPKRQDESQLLLPEDHIVYCSTVHIPMLDSETSDYEKLFCPGKVLHLIERKSSFDVIHGDRQIFESIAIAPNMIANHIPDNVKKAFDVIHSEHPHIA